MSYEEILTSLTLVADASLAQYTGVPGIPGSANPNYGKQYRFVKVTGANQCGLATAGTDMVVGVMQNKPQVTGQAATVAVAGVSNVMAGAAFSAGDKVTVDNQGRAIKATGSDFVGVALMAAEKADVLAPVLLGHGLV